MISVHLSRKRYILSCSAAIAILFVSLFSLWQLKRTDHVQYPVLHPSTYFFFFLSVATIYALSIFLWCRFFSLFNRQRDRKDAFIDMGFIAIGKYLPGKIWGLLLRGSTDQQKIKLSRNNAAISVLEQVFSLCIGVFLVVLLVLSQQYVELSTVFILCFFLTAGLSLPVIPITSWFLDRIKRFSMMLIIPPLSTRFLLGLGYALLWVISAVPILVLMRATMPLGIAEVLSITAAFLASMIIGWVAIFAPGGIGVRESVFILLAPDFLTWQEALYWIALHRGLFVLFDAAYGSVCLVMISLQRKQGV